MSHIGIVYAKIWKMKVKNKLGLVGNPCLISIPRFLYQLGVIKLMSPEESRR